MSDLVLKPCPLCGIDLFHNGAIELGDIYEHPNNGCALQVAWFTARPEWVEKWNRRADADRIEALERERDARQEDSDSYKASMKTYFGQSLSENNAKVEAQRALAASQAEASRLREALTYAAMGLGRIHDSLLSNGPKQASGEMAMHFRDKARAALSSGSKT